MPEISIFFIFVIAIFVQTSAGFGSALIAMPLLALIIGTRTAAPLFALSYIGMTIVITYRYRRDLKLKNIWQMLIASLIAIPIGVNFISHLDENVTLFICGLFIIAYALYALMGFQPPRLKNRSWQWVMGFIAGLLGGAYNTSGPAYVLYADSQQWSPFEFKGNLHVLFLVSNLFVTFNHFIVGNITGEVLILIGFAIAGVAVGVALGLMMDRFIQPEPFRKVVQVLLLFIGIGLLIPS